MTLLAQRGLSWEIYLRVYCVYALLVGAKVITNYCVLGKIIRGDYLFPNAMVRVSPLVEHLFTAAA